MTCITMDRYCNPIRIICIPSIRIHSDLTQTQFINTHWNRVNQLPIESSHVTLNTAPFFRVVQFILGGETIQCIYYPLYIIPQTIKIHVSVDILACSCLSKVKSGSSESRFNGEYDRPFIIVRLPTT